MLFQFPSNLKKTILALGAESAGNFSVYENGKIFLSEDFGDLLNEDNFNKYKGSLNKYLNDKKLKPDIILTDLHPLYKTTTLGGELAKKFRVKNIQIQHHLAHAFSSIGENMLQKTINKKQLTNISNNVILACPESNLLMTDDQRPTTLYGIVLDGTGYGSDGNIWGGEVFEIINNKQFPPEADQPLAETINRIGHLENQTMIGGDLAVREPSRMMISILDKFMEKKEVYKYVKKYYKKNEFEVLYNQLKQNFNCQLTSSTGRILDAVSVLLGFAKNERNYKHEAATLLEKNSANCHPRECGDPDIYCSSEVENFPLKPLIQKQDNSYILNTTHLFKYLIKNINKDKKELAYVAQLYIAEGLYTLVCLSEKERPGIPNEIPHPKGIRDDNRKECHSDLSGEIPSLSPVIPAEAGIQTKNIKPLDPRVPPSQSYGRIGKPEDDKKIFLSGGISKNKIISEYLVEKGVHINKKIPCGDAGISFGQIFYCLFSKPVNTKILF